MNTATNPATLQYIGEHLLPGQFGYFFTLLSLVASLVASFAFAKAFYSNNIEEEQSWNKLAKIAFGIEVLTVIASFVILTYVISNHLFEYKYAYSHSDKNLPFEYLLSCFWEGQEGSFLLWSFWHCVLGSIIMFKVKWRPNGVMMSLSFVQFLLASMVIGVYIFGAKVGSSPFILLREEMNWPILSRPDYLQFIKDGTGLNTTLQNYWMVIHPPVLFLGFASTTIPFAFAVAGLLKKDNNWMNHVLSWANFSAGVLGLGIMMGAAWAYESLNFGGYWAWDPVENASLVPWLVLVAGIHTTMIFRKTGSSVKASYLFMGLSFLLIVYSTFLTRSGILGDTSVHAFTDLGMNAQLLVFLLIFVIPFFVLYFVRYRFMVEPSKEDDISSREFWMLVGSLVLVLSAVVIIAITSIPVFNKIFGTKIAPPEDPEFAHNQVQVFVAIIIGILSAFGQYLRFKHTPSDQIKKQLLLPSIVTIAISAVLFVFVGVAYTQKGPGFVGALYVGILASVYTVVANFHYWLGVLKGKLKSAGASVGHIGFGLVLLGIFLSASNKTVISFNTTGINVLQESADMRKSPVGNPRENITLFEGINTDMGKYMVEYTRDTLDNLDKRFFELKFTDKKTNEQFFLYPDILKNNKGAEGFSANPDAKHYWLKDIFVYITSFQDHSEDDTVAFKPAKIKMGDSIFYSNGYIKLNQVLVNPNANRPAGTNELVLDLQVTSKEGLQYSSKPGIVLEGLNMEQELDTIKAQNLVISFNKVVSQEEGVLEIGIKESKSLTNLITLKVYEFPFINVLWIGVVVMTIGFMMSMFQRIRKNKAI
ncbi:MAG: cytochrome c biogenesis protein CcsA [Sediminibacterium sp.]